MGRGGADVDDDDGWWQRSHQAMVETAAGRQAPVAEARRLAEFDGRDSARCSARRRRRTRRRAAATATTATTTTGRPRRTTTQARAGDEEARGAGSAEGRAERRFGGCRSRRRGRVVRVTVFPESAALRAGLARARRREHASRRRSKRRCGSSSRARPATSDAWVAAVLGRRGRRAGHRDVQRPLARTRRRRGEPGPRAARASRRGRRALVADVGAPAAGAPWIPEAVRRTFEFPLPTIVNAFGDVPVPPRLYGGRAQRPRRRGGPRYAPHRRDAGQQRVRRWPTLRLR